MAAPSSASPLLAAARLIAKAERVVVLTGAGISEESGVPTYRGVTTTSSSNGISNNGLWDGIKGTFGAIMFGTKLGWLLAPSRAWELYVDRLLRPVLLAQPNAAHQALVDLERLRSSSFRDRRKEDGLPIITQNVDGLHHLAGSSNVLQVHGTIREHRCTWNHKSVEIEPQTILKCKSNHALPHCPQCWFGAVRPRVVFFGESMPFQTWTQSYQYVSSLGPNDVLLVVGTSGQVQPVASLPQLALEQGATVVEINASSEPCIERQLVYYMHDGDYNVTASSTRWVPQHQLIHVLGQKAGVILPQLVQLVQQELSKLHKRAPEQSANVR
mgnify:CR=1 FL=1